MTESRAYTLLEVMVVTVLMAMVAAMTVVSLGAADQTAQMMSVIASIKDLDIRGRMLAKTSGHSSAITLETDRIALVGHMDDTPSEEISRITLPANLQIRLEVNHENVHHIIFDRFGRSADYTVTLTFEGRTRQITVYGLTGSTRELENPS